MLIAEIRRKLNALASDALTAEDLKRLLSDTKEDLLTADVFGSLKYLPRHPYLSEVLNAIFAGTAWRDLPARIAGGLAAATFEFWPHYSAPQGLPGGNTEPDVVLSTPDVLIFFEMKLHSALGDRQIERQLGIALEQAAGREAFVVIVSNGLRMPAFSGGRDHSFASCVRAAKAAGEMSPAFADRLIAASSRVLWINWYGIQATLTRAHQMHGLGDGRETEAVARAADLLSDLNEVFHLRGIRPFRGLASALAGPPPLPWTLGLSDLIADAEDEVASLTFSLASALSTVPLPFRWSCGVRIAPATREPPRDRVVSHPFRLARTVSDWPAPDARLGLSFGEPNA